MTINANRLLLYISKRILPKVLSPQILPYGSWHALCFILYLELSFIIVG